MKPCRSKRAIRCEKQLHVFQDCQKSFLDLSLVSLVPYSVYKVKIIQTFTLVLWTINERGKQFRDVLYIGQPPTVGDGK